MTIEDAKLYLRIDGNDEDALINDLLKASESYLSDAIDDYETKKAENGPEWVAKAEQARRLLIADWYENRLAVGRPECAAVSLLLAQLQL